jgi:serine/threonine protein kinase
MGEISDPEGPRRLGDFEILREIGRGGMGVVYEERQVSLNRPVALKVLSGGLGLTPKAVQRFRREAEAAAKLHHTNIVPVYATGEEGGTHFYAMELIDGPSLDHVIRQLRQVSRGRQPPDSASPPGADARSPELVATGPYVGKPSSDQALSTSALSSGSHYFDTVARMVAEVADALEYAHQQGVVHRDVKPSNLLLSPAGRLSLTDFGLARVLEQPGMTLSGEFVGTPAYMSPEQITVGRIPLDHRTDIYSLGATLYELLTLEPPFTGKSREQVLAQIVQKEPKPPRRIQKRVPVDLETICLKCLDKDPDRRYQTAGQLAEDLRRYVNRFAIRARRAGPVRRLVKWVKRRPALAGSLSCVLLAVCVALAFAYQAHRAEQQRAEEKDRHRLQLLDEKINNAYLVASGGELDKTEEAIKEIERLGASPGQVRLLKGTVYHFRGDTRRAISELEQAMTLLPESVAARALLARSYANNGQWGRSGELLDEIESLSPSSPEDYLFKGYAQGGYSEGGQDGIANLTEGIRLRPSPLGRALRAGALADRAHDTGEQKYVEEALRDADAARGMVPDNPRVLCYSAYCRLVAAGIYREANILDKRDAVREDLKRDVQALEPFLDDIPNVGWPEWFYYEEIGDRNESLKIAQRMFESSGSPLAANYCVIDLYHLGRFEKALQFVDRRKQTDVFGDIMRPMILAELHGKPRALQEYKKMTRDLPEDALWVWRDVPLFLGEKESAVSIFQHPPRTQGQQSRDVRAQKEFQEAESRFARGEISDDMLLAKAGISHLRRVEAYHYLGLFRLATGDRDGAREFFLKARGNRPCWTFSYLFCQMFLIRMEKDQNWPRWVQPNKGQPKP